MVQPPILKSQKPSKMIETHFYRLYSIILDPKSLLALPQNYDTKLCSCIQYLLPICGQICQGMPYLCIFVKRVVP